MSSTVEAAVLTRSIRLVGSIFGICLDSGVVGTKSHVAEADTNVLAERIRASPGTRQAVQLPGCPQAYGLA